MSVDGFCEPRFHSVREEFERNFAERGEMGASVCVVHRGNVVVDLWGGVSDRHTRAAWQRDTIGVVWSSTKGAVAACAHLLVARGQLDLDAPVALYWPEFAQAGKQDIPVRWVLSHQAGIPVLRQPLQPGELYDHGRLATLLAAEEPFWEPGTRQGYHAITFGPILDELIRRISGRDVGAYFCDEFAGPLGLDFHIGLPEEAEPRVAPNIRPDPLPPGETPWRFLVQAQADRSSIQGLMIYNTGRPVGDIDSRQAHAAVLPSQGGITNGRGLAGLYAGLLGGLFDRVSLARMQATASASAHDATLLLPMRFSLGFVKSSDNSAGPSGARDSIVLSDSAFGHPGMGGSLGFADPAEGLALGYTMNKQGRGVLLNARGQALVDAVYRSLGYTSREPGFWIREE